MFLKLKSSRSIEHENYGGPSPTDQGTSVRVLSTPKHVSCDYEFGDQNMTPRKSVDPVDRHTIFQM